MPVIAVVNRKGGSGKSTLSTHLAAWLAARGKAVMLGDVDRQQSTRAWLKRRDPTLPAIVPWALDQRNVLRVPTGVTHVVLDTPGGMQGFDLARVVMSTDAILMPVCNSIFDRDSAAACHAELLTLPRVASGRCKLGVIGMRLDARTHAADTLREWSAGLNVPFLGILRETQHYVKSLENGQTIFDLPARLNHTDLLQWEPILAWLGPIMGTAAAQPKPPMRLDEMATSIASDHSIQTARAPSLMPAQVALVHGDRLSVFANQRAAQTH